PFKTEIHPPFLLSHVRTQKRQNGDPETVAEIWIDGYFPGEPISLILWPPPRPTPDSVLTIIKPVDVDVALGLTPSFTMSNQDVRVRFTAPHREVDVDTSGKMNWETGRGYEGEWEVFWSHP